MAIGENQHGFLMGIWGGGQHGMVAGGMEAKDHLGLGWFFNAQALRADGHAAIGTDVQGGAHAPHIMRFLRFCGESFRVIERKHGIEQ